MYCAAMDSDGPRPEHAPFADDGGIKANGPYGPEGTGTVMGSPLSLPLVSMRLIRELTQLFIKKELIRKSVLVVEWLSDSPAACIWE